MDLAVVLFTSIPLLAHELQSCVNIVVTAFCLFCLPSLATALSSLMLSVCVFPPFPDKPIFCKEFTASDTREEHWVPAQGVRKWPKGTKSVGLPTLAWKTPGDL